MLTHRLLQRLTLLLVCAAGALSACIYRLDSTFDGLNPGDATAVFVDVDGTTPAAGALTILEGAGLSRLSGGDGRVTFRALPAGQQTWFTTWDKNQDGVVDGAARVSFRLRQRNGTVASVDLGKLRLEPTVTVLGTVRVA